MAANASATFGLSINEKWIRERLNLQKESLDDVRSLSLPGSYCEKITHLGRSLLGFTRLKHLDLSRNALESLEGLDHLDSLETLNLYYNNVSSLKELFRLGHNKKLKELDFRLNPVTKNEPDYRLFLVHMLIYLRKLDDRGVRDSERKAAVMHFDTDQAFVFEENVRQKQGRKDPPVHSAKKPASSRVELVRSLAPRHGALEDDTDRLLDLISRSEELTTPPPPAYSGHRYHLQTSPPPLTYPRSTSSSPAKSPSPHVCRHSHNHHGDRPHRDDLQHHHKGHHHHHDDIQHHHGDHHHHSDHQHHANIQKQTKKKMPKIRSPDAPVRHPPARELNYTGEEERRRDDGRYRDVKVVGNFTPAPVVTIEKGTPLPSSRHALEQLLTLLQDRVDGDLMVLVRDEGLQEDFSQWYEDCKRSSPPEEGAGQQVECLQGEVEALQGELRNLEAQLRDRDKNCADHTSKIKELEVMLSEHKAELQSMRHQLEGEVTKAELAGKKEAAAREAHKTLQHNKKEMLSVQKQLKMLQEENRALQQALDHAPSLAQLEEAHKQIEVLKAEGGGLRGELESVVERHRQDLVNSTQLQDLATMLQESHRSLVATNDHLLQELEESKQRHGLEIAQLNSNYQQLRKTIQIYSK